MENLSAPSLADSEIEASLRYLESDEAEKTISADPYWPKWDSPWWHMLLLHEMGETKRIPERIVRAHIESLNRIPLKIFPIHPGEMPEGLDPFRGTPCHCQLGNVYQVLAKWGVDVDRELPWIRPWFLRYQMADGGLNCDNDAYLVKGECPSSMVGTIAAFEAILLYTPREWTREERRFLESAAGFLKQRKLIQGSSTAYNASERESAKSWSLLCFPRFYLYDVLRGLRALVAWSKISGEPLDRELIREAVSILETQFPDDQVRLGRRSYEGAGSIRQNEQGEWIRKQPATLFPLLSKVSEVGSVSPYLNREWAEVRDYLASNA